MLAKSQRKSSPTMKGEKVSPFMKCGALDGSEKILSLASLPIAYEYG